MDGSQLQDGRHLPPMTQRRYFVRGRSQCDGWILLRNGRHRSRALEAPIDAAGSQLAASLPRRIVPTSGGGSRTTESALFLAALPERGGHAGDGWLLGAPPSQGG